MRSMRKAILLWVLGGLEMLLVKLASNSEWLHEELPPNAVLLLMLLVWTLGLVTVAFGTWQWYRTRGIPAVEVFLLDGDGKLCLYQHPFHKMKLPPGGRVGPLETMHHAIERHLKERIGLDKTDYILRSVHPAAMPTAVFGNVEVLPCPFRVQAERHRQRGFRGVHLDFLFAATLKPNANLAPDDRYKPVAFCSLSDVKQLHDGNSLMPDVYDAYSALLQADRDPDA